MSLAQLEEAFQVKISTSLNNKKGFKYFLALIFWLILWEVIPRVFNTGIYFPSFSETLNALYLLLKTSEFYIDVSLSLLRVIIGFSISIFTGFVIGIICSLNEVVDTLISFIMSIIRSTPVSSFIILTLIWFNVDFIPIFICFLMVLPIIFENTKAGIRSVDIKLKEVLKIYNINTKTYIKMILLPALKPFLYTSILASFGLGWKASISAEILTRPDNAIGSSIFDAKIYLETPQLFAYTLCVIILSFLFEVIVKHYGKKLKGDF